MKEINISDHIGHNISDELLEQLIEAGHDVVRVENGSVFPDCETWSCDRNGTTHHSNEISVTVNAGCRHAEVWCHEAAQASAFKCTALEEYYCSEEFTMVQVDGEDVCFEANEDSLYYWEFNGTYHWEPEPELEGGEFINSYHGADKPWERSDYTIPKGAIGVEFEGWADDRQEAAEYATSLGFTCEEDSSLCGRHGFETIGEPMELKEYARQGNPWQKFCENSGVKGWYAKDGCYGMHVSVNVTNASLLNCTKAVVFIHSNEELCTAIAGRERNRWNEYHGDVTTKNARLRSSNHSSAVSWDQPRGRFELRIFRANARWEGFLRNVEFAHSVIEFTRQAKVSKGELTEEHYTDWMLALAGRKDTYPAMTRWLRHRKFGTPITAHAA